MVTVAQQRAVQVIVPARNEQGCIGRCLKSLVSQQGIDFQIMVVDDGSTDRTREIAESFAGVRVITADQPQGRATGKCNALMTGAANATARWLLFTDADTFHYPDSLAAAICEAEKRGLDLLSYSPEQEAISWSELALMPVIFAELALRYPPDQVNDPMSPVAAANGQYLLVRRKPYEQLGGHRAVADKLLEDVELARLFKSSGYKIGFRFGAGLAKTRMYRDFSSMLEGWTKNLALLFERPLWLAVRRLLEFAIVLAAAGASVATIGHYPFAGLALLIFGGLVYIGFLLRIRRAHFTWPAHAVAFFGLPLFALFLFHSHVRWNVRHAVMWKGRLYGPEPITVPESSIQEGHFTRG